MKPDKSTVNEIRRRFDADVERFSNLETGQVAAQDGRLALELIAQAAAHTAPGAASLLISAAVQATTACAFYSYCQDCKSPCWISASPC